MYQNKLPAREIKKAISFTIASSILMHLQKHPGGERFEQNFFDKETEEDTENWSRWKNRWKSSIKTPTRPKAIYRVNAIHRNADTKPYHMVVVRNQIGRGL